MTTLYVLACERGSYSDYSAEILAVCEDETSAMALAERHYQARRVEHNAERAERLARARAEVESLAVDDPYRRHYPHIFEEPPPPWYRAVPPGPLRWESVRRRYDDPDAEPVARRAETPMGNDDAYLIAPIVLNEFGRWLVLP
jgi:hypothetical protein